jgi:hypothetical protein
MNPLVSEAGFGKASEKGTSKDMKAHIAGNNGPDRFFPPWID